MIQLLWLGALISMINVCQDLLQKLGQKHAKFYVLYLLQRLFRIKFFVAMEA
jgi:hypothetical protein